MILNGGFYKSVFSIGDRYMNRLEQLEERAANGGLHENEMKEIDRLRETRLTVDSAMETIVRELNTMGNEEFVAGLIGDRLSITHRTLQQNFWRSIAQVIERLASTEPNRYDARNEASVKWAKEVAKLKSYFPFI